MWRGGLTRRPQKRRLQETPRRDAVAEIDSGLYLGTRRRGNIGNGLVRPAVSIRRETGKVVSPAGWADVSPRQGREPEVFTSRFQCRFYALVLKGRGAWKIQEGWLC